MPQLPVRWTLVWLLVGAAWLGPWGQASVEAVFLVASRGTNQILKYNDDGTFAGIFAQNGSGGITELDAPQDIVLGPDNNIYVSTFNTDTVLKLSPTGTQLGKINNSNAFRPNAPTGIGFASDGSLLVASFTDNLIRRYNSSLVHIGDLTNGAGGLSGPNGIVIQGGKLYVASSANDRVLRYDVATQAYEATFVSSGIDNPQLGLLFNGSNLYIASAGTMPAVKTSNGSPATNLVAGGDLAPISGLGVPRDFITGPNGDLFITDAANASPFNMVWRYNISTQVLSQFITSGLGGLDQPRGILYLNDAAVVPEPSSLVLVGAVGCLAAAGVRRRRRRAA